MTDEREAWESGVLADVFAKAGAMGGSLGGAVGGSLGGGAGGGGGGFFGGSRGGARGGRWGANRLKNNVCELELTLPMNQEQALEKANAVVAEHGKPLESPFTTPGVPTVVGLVGSTWQNPAVVTIEIPSSAEDESQVRVRAVAKRSPIIRHTGDKVAERIREELSQK